MVWTVSDDSWIKTCSYETILLFFRRNEAPTAQQHKTSFCIWNLHADYVGWSSRQVAEWYICTSWSIFVNVRCSVGLMAILYFAFFFYNFWKTKRQLAFASSGVTFCLLRLLRAFNFSIFGPKCILNLKNSIGILQIIFSTLSYWVFPCS